MSIKIPEPSEGAIYAALGIGALLIIWAAWWFIIIRPAENAAKAEVATAEGSFATARTESARDAIGVQDRALGEAATTEQTSKENADAIHQAPGADVRLDPALNRTARERLCNRASYRDRPECVQLARRAKPAG